MRNRWVWLAELGLWIIIALCGIALFKISVDRVSGQTMGGGGGGFITGGAIILRYCGNGAKSSPGPRTCLGEDFPLPPITSEGLRDPRKLGWCSYLVVSGGGVGSSASSSSTFKERWP